MKLPPLAAAIAIGLMAAPAALAITDTEANAGIQFNFSNPGARSMAMGGAFIGLADDATAAYTNPAGLTQLSSREVSLEVRHIRYDTRFVAGGAARLSPFDVSGVDYGNADSSVNSPSYLSVVFPFNGAAVALFRHEQANFDTAFHANAVDLLDTGSELRAFDSDADLKLVDYGIAAAWRPSDMVSMGVGLSLYDFSFDTTSARFRAAAGEVSSVQRQHGDDTRIGITVGARFTPSERLSLGAVFRQGPQFAYEGVNTVFLDFNNDPVDPPEVVQFERLAFNVPNSFGIGASFRPSDVLTINFDVNRVQYSDLTDSVQSLLGNTSDELAGIRLEDGEELRVGGEYVFTDYKYPFSLRAGVWRDPSHGIEYRVTNGTTDSSLAALFSVPSENEMHYSLGGGLVFENFQVDIAADLSARVDTFSVSGVWRF